MAWTRQSLFLVTFALGLVTQFWSISSGAVAVALCSLAVAFAALAAIRHRRAIRALEHGKFVTQNDVIIMAAVATFAVECFIFVVINTQSRRAFTPQLP